MRCNGKLEANLVASEARGLTVICDDQERTREWTTYFTQDVVV